MIDDTSTDYSPSEHFGQTNLVDILDEDFVQSIGFELLEKITDDERTREGWLQQHEEYLKLATQYKEIKNTPWPGASNVKYPLLTNACLQFHARALPALLGTNRPVKSRVIGADADGEKHRRGMRVSTYMSYQLLEEMEEWVDEFDRLLFILPMLGVCYKKTYYSPALRRLKSILLTPSDVIVNYEAKSFERARITEILEISNNEYLELVREGIWADVEPSLPAQDLDKNSSMDAVLGRIPPKQNSDTPHQFYESHCWLDLDEDGYEEPYIVTIHKDSARIARIVPRWEERNLVSNSAGEIVKIKAENFFTQWIFFPDPYSAVSGMGFGTLLGPNNHAINTLMNQMIDGGTKDILGGGFIGRGARLKGGSVRIMPGEYKLINSTGDDIRKSIVPLPTSGSSGALFSLLQLLIQVGDQTGSITDMIKGENPGQNQKVGTTMAVLEQGLKIYTSIYSRLHRALTKEYKQIYNLNRQYLDEEHYQTILDELPSEEQLIEMLQQQGADDQQIQEALDLRLEQIGAGVEDFEDTKVDVLPASEPSMISDTLQLMKSQSLMEKLQQGMQLNPEVVTRRVLEAEQHADIDELMAVAPAPPSIDDRKIMLATLKEQRESVNNYFDNLLKVADAESKEKGIQLNAYKAAVDGIGKQLDRENKQNGADQPTPTEQVRP